MPAWSELEKYLSSCFVIIHAKKCIYILYKFLRIIDDIESDFVIAFEFLWMCAIKNLSCDGIFFSSYDEV
jgi:hypothetical protein